MKLLTLEQKQKFVRKAEKWVDSLPSGFITGKQNVKFALAEYFASRGLTNYKRRMENE